MKQDIWGVGIGLPWRCGATPALYLSASGTLRVARWPVLRWPVLRCRLGVGQLPVAAMVAVFVDELPRQGQGFAVLEQAGAVEQGIGQVQGHGTSLGDVLCLVKISGGAGVVSVKAVNHGSGEQAAGKLMYCTSPAKAVYRGLDVTAGGSQRGSGRQRLGLDLQ